MAAYRRTQGERERVVVLMLPTEIAAVDAWGVPRGLNGRSEAIRQLIERGLRALAEDARNENADEIDPGKVVSSASQHPASGGPNVDVI